MNTDQCRSSADATGTAKVAHEAPFHAQNRPQSAGSADSADDSHNI
jgi:hypothetical protein